MTPPAPPAVLHARQVVKDLQAAEAKLCNAQAGTDDRFVADFIGDARKDLRVALKRAKWRTSRTARIAGRALQRETREMVAKVMDEVEA